VHGAWELLLFYMFLLDAVICGCCCSCFIYIKETSLRVQGEIKDVKVMKGNIVNVINSIPTVIAALLQPKSAV
jgi:hypothetical protein